MTDTITTIPDTLAAAHALHTAGMCVLPVKSDGSKRPSVATWTRYQTEQTTTQQINGWFAGQRPGIGIVTGAISGNLELLEFEGRAVNEGVLQKFADVLNNTGLHDLWHKVSNGWVEQSPSGGVHFHYRITGTPVPGNTKLADRLARQDELTDDERDTLTRHPNKKILRGLIETRGEGGFVVTAPSHSTVHPTGQPWARLVGGPADTPTITAGEHAALHQVARSLSAVPREDTKPAPWTAPQPTDEANAWLMGAPSALEGDLRPGDDFDNRNTWADILIPHGWTVQHTSGQTTYWCRPGKTTGISATTGHADDRDRLYVFTTSTEFEQETPYTKFGAYAILNHGGNHTDAGKALRQQGYGAQKPVLASAPPVLATATPTAPAAPGGLLPDPDDPDTAAAGIFVGTMAADGSMAPAPAPTIPAQAAPQTPQPPQQPARGLVLTPASQIRIRPVRWLWDTTPDSAAPTSHGRIPMNSLAIAAGGPGLGKSQYACWMTARITTGTLPGELWGKPRGVIYAATEDSWSYTIAPRLIAAGADMEMVFRIDVQDDTDTNARLTLPVDTARIGEAAELYSIALLVADPLLSLIDASINDYRAAEVRAALEPLVAAADRHHFTILGLAHFTKAGTADPLSRIAGSGAFGQLIRCLVAFAKHENDEGDDAFVMSLEKNNLGRLGLPSHAYVIQSATVDTEEGPSYVSRFVLGPETTATSVKDVMRAEGQPDDREAMSDAMAWLHGFLTDVGGEEQMREIKMAARKQGISDSAIDRAKRRLGLKSRQHGFGKDKGARWFLPEAWVEGTDD